MSDIALWQIPKSVAADKSRKWHSRVWYYRVYQHHYLGDKTKVIPNIATCMNVIRAYDEFGPDFPVAVSIGSYVEA